MRLHGAWWIGCAIGATTATLVAGCSLLVSTSGFDGPNGGAASQDDANPPESGGPSPTSDDASLLDSSTDGRIDDPRLLGAWSFDQASSDGTFPDLTGNGNNASLENGAAFVANGGHRGGAIEMHRSIVESIAVPTLDGDKFPPVGTLSVWFLFTDVRVNESIGLFDFFDRQRLHLFARHGNDEPDLTRFQVAMQGPNAQNYQWVNFFNAGPAVWHHFALTWNASTRTFAIHLDGQVSSRDVADGNSPILFTGQRVRFGAALSGMIDEARIYSAVLSDAEIASLP